MRKKAILFLLACVMMTLIGCNGGDTVLPPITTLPTGGTINTETRSEDGMLQNMPSNANEELIEENKRIIQETLNLSDNNSRNISRSFARLNIRIEKFEVEETMIRDDRIVGYKVRIEDSLDNIYYLKIGDRFGVVYGIYKDSVDGEQIEGGGGS